MNMMATVSAVPAVAFTAAAPAVAATGDRRAWDAAMARFKAAEQACEVAGKRADAASAAFFKAREEVPHVELGPDPYTGRSKPVSTADANLVNHARRVTKALDEGKMRLDPIRDVEEHYTLMRQLAEAAVIRDAKINALDRQLGYTVAQEACDAAVERKCDARDVLLEMPAPDGEALLWKLDWLFFTDHVWDEDFVAQTIADTKRMLRSAH